jgi:hypothetical protein
MTGLRSGAPPRCPCSRRVGEFQAAANALGLDRLGLLAAGPGEVVLLDWCC